MTTFRKHARNLIPFPPRFGAGKPRTALALFGAPSAALVLAATLLPLAAHAAQTRIVPGTQAHPGETALHPDKLPPLPPGQPTVIGGIIEKLDPVRDQFTLKIFGGQSLKILYDPRTTLFHNGVSQSLLTLRNHEAASVETTLDKTAVFAVSIHTISKVPTGECQGQVLRSNPSLNQITVRCGLSSNPILFDLPPGVTVTRVGQMAGAAPVPASAQDLGAGDLVSVQFQSAFDGRGTASDIAILASRGMPFVFAGRVSFLDRRAGRLTVETGPGASYSLAFNPVNFPPSSDLQLGKHVKVTATFNGSGYTAQDIEPE